MEKTESKALDAIELLESDHRKVEDLFEQFENLNDDDAEAASEIIETACIELQIHDKLETEIFYPAVREQAQEEQVEDVLDEAEVEHDTVRELIDKIEGMQWEDEKLKAHFTVLIEYVKHHVKEERQEMFPKVKALKSLDLKALGAEMSERKAELLTELGVKEESEDEAIT